MPQDYKYANSTTYNNRILYTFVSHSPSFTHSHTHAMYTQSTRHTLTTTCTQHQTHHKNRNNAREIHAKNSAKKFGSLGNNLDSHSPSQGVFTQLQPKFPSQPHNPSPETPAPRWILTLILVSCALRYNLMPRNGGKSDKIQLCLRRVPRHHNNAKPH